MYASTIMNFEAVISSCCIMLRFLLRILNDCNMTISSCSLLKIKQQMKENKLNSIVNIEKNPVYGPQAHRHLSLQTNGIYKPVCMKGQVSLKKNYTEKVIHLLFLQENIFRSKILLFLPVHNHVHQFCIEYANGDFNALWHDFTGC